MVDSQHLVILVYKTTASTALLAASQMKDCDFPDMSQVRRKSVK